MIIANLLLFLSFAVGSAINGHYLLSAFTLLFGLYELTGPLAIEAGSLGLVDEGIFGSALRLFSLRSHDLNEFNLLILLTLLTVYGTYFTVGRRALKSRQVVYSKPDGQLILINFFVLLSGLYAMYTGAGTLRLNDYLGYAEETTRFYSYGLSMLTPAFIIAIEYWRKTGNKIISIALLLTIIPICIEAFISSRRQFIAPIFIILVFFILYRMKGYRKIYMTLSLLAIAIIFMGAQFMTRAIFSYEYGGVLSFYDMTLGPQFGEFISIGATSLYAWYDFIWQGMPISYGFNLIYSLLNSVPFLRLGDYIWDDYGVMLLADYRSLSPNGGLSFVAESIYSFGFIGTIIFGMLCGFLLYKGQESLVGALGSGRRLSDNDIYKLSLISILLLKYRSGLGDAIFFVITFSILYKTLSYLSVLIFEEIKRRAN